MSNLSPAAALIWSDYLEHVRQALSSLTESDQDEVINELEAHLAEETGAGPEPVSESSVQAVMARLGTAQEIAEGYGIAMESPASLGMDSNALIAISLAALSAGLIFPVLEFITIPIAAIASRIALSNHRLRESAYRFAAYPGLLLGYLALLILGLAWPLAIVMPLAATGGFLPQLLQERDLPLLAGTTEYWMLVWAAFVAITALWWLCLAQIIRGSNLQLSKVFFPFVKTQSRAGTRFLNIGAVILFAAAVFIAVFA